MRQINPSGKISLFPKGKSPLDSRHPVPEEGALAIVTERWDRERWTRRHRARKRIAGRDKLRERSQNAQTSGAEAYGKTVWIRRLSGWRQVSWRREVPTGTRVPVFGRRRGHESPIPRDEREISRQAIAQGMSDVLRCPVCSCAHSSTHCTRDRGCSAHPAFPAPSFSRDNNKHSSGSPAARSRTCIWCLK